MVFISVIISTILVWITTYAHKTTCTQFGKHWPLLHWLCHQKMLQYGWVWFLLLCSTKQDTNRKEKIMGAQVKRTVPLFALVVNTTCNDKLKHVRILISTPKMLWKVVAKRVCVMVCKPNAQDDIQCIWELDDQPQISKVEGTFNYG